MGRSNETATQLVRLVEKNSLKLVLLLSCAGVQQFPALSAAISVMNLLPPAPELLQSQRNWGLSESLVGNPGYQATGQKGNSAFLLLPLEKIIYLMDHKGI